MTNPQELVAEFQTAFGFPIASEAGFTDRTHLRHMLIEEEVEELWTAVEHRRLVDTADALADLVYVTYGMALELGIDLNAVLEIVHERNMAKLGGPVRDDGKQLKPEGWYGPEEQIGELLNGSRVR